MGHHANSPSVVFRRKLCPGSKRMEAQYPDTDNEHSLRGTACHHVAEFCLNNKEDPHKHIGEPIQVPKVDGTNHVHVFNAEDAEAVWAYVSYIRTRQEQMGGAWMQVEQKVHPSIWLHRDDVDGTLDCSLSTKGEMEIIDYKHGAGVAVDPEDNPQLTQYMIGKLAEVDWGVTPYDLPVKLTIVQPRCPHPRGPVRTWETTADHFFGLVEGLKDTLAKTDDPEAPLVPGEAQCRFCKAKGACPAVAKEAMGAFSPVQGVTQGSTSGGNGAQQQNLEKSPWSSVESALGQPAEVLQPAQIAQILDKAPMIQAWLKGVQEHAKDLALDGTEIPGYKLVHTKSIRKWELGDEEMIKKLAGVRDREKKAIGTKDACSIKPLSPAQAEKTIKPRCTARTWKNVEKLMIKPEGAPTLAPLTDPRAPILKAEQVFQPVTAENPFG